MTLEDRVRETIRRHKLLTPEQSVVAAVSGGSDSVALAYLLNEFDRRGECRLVGLAHFNHQLRVAADGDEAFCVKLAESLGRPLILERADIRAIARREDRSIEGAAHTARHAFLNRARQQLGADLVALGHTKDDQAETFLLRLLRGAGSRGLGSMHPRRGTLIRPLLDCRRAELQAYLQERGIAFVHDETNEDVSVPRNRVRAELLPFLERRFNPSIVDALAEESELAREAYQYLENAAREHFSRIVRVEGDRWILDSVALAGCPGAIARQVVRQALTEAARGRAIRFADVRRTLDVVAGATAFDGPGQRVERIGDVVVLTSRPAGAKGRPAAANRQVNLFRYPLSIPGEVHVPEAGCVVSAEFADGAESALRAANGHGVAAVQLDKKTGGLAVRNRRPGDRFRPFGLGGRTKLQDFFVDHKVVREDRDRVPIIVDDRDRIVWVAGHAIC